jgi:hypothetical protein
MTSLKTKNSNKNEDSNKNNNDDATESFYLDDFLLTDNDALTQKESELIEKGRRRILEANKTAFIKYKMLSVEEFREIISQIEYASSSKTAIAPIWFDRILSGKMPLIYPKNLFD